MQTHDIDAHDAAPPPTIECSELCTAALVAEDIAARARQAVDEFDTAGLRETLRRLDELAATLRGIAGAQ